MQVRPEKDERKLYKFTVEYKDSKGDKHVQAGRVWTDNPAKFRKALLERYDVPGTREILFITLVECEPAVPKTGEEMAAQAKARANLPAVITAPTIPPTSTSNANTNDNFYKALCSSSLEGRKIPNFFEKERALFERITTLQPKQEANPI